MSCRGRGWLQLVWLLALAALALVLRLARLGDANVWYDEGLAVWAARHSLPDMAAWTASDVHPPLYFAVLHAWRLLIGDAEAAIRLPSVVFGTLTVPAVWLLGRTLLPGQPRVALASAALLAVARFDVWWSQEARMYALAGLLATLHLVFTVRLARHMAVWPALGYLLTAALGLWTLYLLAALFAVDALYWLVTGSGRRCVRWLAARLGLMIAAWLLFVPWLAFALPRLQSWSVQESVDVLSFGRLYATLLLLGRSTDLDAITPLVLALLVGLAAGLASLARRRDAAARALIAPLLAVLVPGLMVWLLTAVPRSVGYAPRVEARYLLPFAPAFTLLVALAVEGLAGWVPPRWRGATALGLLGGLMLIGVWSVADYLDGRYLADDDRSLAATLRAFVEPGDAVVLHTDQAWTVFAYHWSGRFVGVPYAQPITRHSADALLSPVWQQSEAVFLVATADALRIDPDRLVEDWLSSRAAASRAWRYGDTRLVLYARTPKRARHLEDLAPGFAPPVAPAAAQALGLVGWEQPLGRVRAGEPSYAALSVAPGAPSRLQVGLGDLSSQLDLPALPAVRRLPITIVVPRETPAGPATWWVEASGQRVVLGQVEILPAPGSAAQAATRSPPVVAVDAIFGQPPLVRLDGYDLDQSPGDQLRVVLHWHVLGTTSTSYKAYVHLLDIAGRMTAQRDDVPGQGHLPTTAWAPGDDLLDVYQVPLPPNLWPGSYQLVVGLYDPTTGERLGPVHAADGSPQVNREAVLGPLALP